MSERIQVKECWNADNPDDFKEKAGYSVVLADGTMAKMWLSQLEVAPKQGEWFEVEALERPPEGKKQWKAKSPRRIGMDPTAAPQNGPRQQSFSGHKDYKADPDKLRAENYRSALHAAINLGGDAESVLTNTKKFFDAIEEAVASAEREGPRAGALAEATVAKRDGEADTSSGLASAATDSSRPSRSAGVSEIQQAAQRVGCAEPVLMAYVRGKGAESLEELDDSQHVQVLAWLEAKA